MRLVWPGGYRARWRAETRQGMLAEGEEPSLVAEEELAALPRPLRAYLVRSGVVGQPRVRNFRLAFTGQFRLGPGAPWKPFRAVQFNRVDPPLRVYLMGGVAGGLPAQALHLFRAGAASMRVKLLTLFQVVDAGGPVLDRTETVTFFNDLCVWAPGALLDRERFGWEVEGPRRVRGWCSLGGRTVSASLLFGPHGELVDFRSGDRFMSADGQAFRALPWSTPLRDHRERDGRWLPRYGEAVWHLPEGDFSYGRFHLADLRYNLDRRA